MRWRQMMQVPTEDLELPPSSSALWSMVQTPAAQYRLLLLRHLGVVRLLLIRSTVISIIAFASRDKQVKFVFQENLSKDVKIR